MSISAAASAPISVRSRRSAAKRGVPLIDGTRKAWALGRGRAGRAAGVASGRDRDRELQGIPKILTTGQGGAVLRRIIKHSGNAAIAVADQGSDANWRRTNHPQIHAIGSNWRRERPCGGARQRAEPSILKLLRSGNARERKRRRLTRSCRGTLGWAA